MSRYIDADNLKKDIAKLHVLRDEKEIRRLYYANPHTSLADFEEILVRIFDAIEAAPTIDAVSVVRCKDCRYWVHNFKGCLRNPCTEPWYATDFCNYGERIDHEE